LLIFQTPWRPIVVKVIPCLDIKDGRVVKGVHFVELRDALDPVEAAVAYWKGGADEIAFLDITATFEKRGTVFELVEKVAEAVDVPVVVGGGIRTLKDIVEAVERGAAKVSISSAAYRDPDMVRDAVTEYGSQRIIVAIDADLNEKMPSQREVYIDGGRTPTGSDAVDFAKAMADIGAGELLPTSKATDGVREGYDIHLTRAIADSTGLPIIASGGAGKLEHFYQAVSEGHAASVLGASVFHFGVFTIREVKEYLKSRGVEVKL
jgi:cyclase